MSSDSIKKRDIQRVVQKVHIGTSISSIDLDDNSTTSRVEIGFPAEMLTVVTTGTLEADVTPMIGNSTAHTTISATVNPSTATTINLFSTVEIERTSGTGKVIILAK